MDDNSISYFPLDCQRNDKIKLIEKEFGLKSFAVIVKLYQKIFGMQGYYCEWTEEIEALFSEEACGLPAGDRLVSEIVKAAFKRGIFSQELFDCYAILTSEEIQEKFVCVVGKRKKSVKMKKAYLLLECAQIPKNVAIEGENDTRAPESFEGKGSEGKGSEAKESDGASAPTPTPAVPNQAKLRRKYGEYGWVMLSDAEYDRLIQQYGESTVKYYIQYVDESAQVTGNKNKWKDWNLTIRKAIRNKWGGGPPNNNKNNIKSYDDDEDFLMR